MPNVEEIDYNEKVVIGGRDIIKLPTLYEYITKYGEVDAFDRYRDILGEDINEFLDTVKILPLVSDPMSVDGDGDGYLDYSERVVYGSDPLHKDVEINCIDYISILYEPGEDIYIYNYAETDPFITKKAYNGIYHSFGGNQNWFTVENFYDSLIEKGGCGLIATIDTLLWLEKINVSRCGDGSYNYDEYAELVRYKHRNEMKVGLLGATVYMVKEWLARYDVKVVIIPAKTDTDELVALIMNELRQKQPIILNISSWDISENKEVPLYY